MASARNGTLYTGVTSNLAQRVWQHKTQSTKGFTQQYACKILVYCEFYPDMLRPLKVKSASKPDHAPRKSH